MKANERGLQSVYSVLDWSHTCKIRLELTPNPSPQDTFCLLKGNTHQADNFSITCQMLRWMIFRNTEEEYWKEQGVITD